MTHTNIVYYRINVLNSDNHYNYRALLLIGNSFSLREKVRMRGY